MAQEDMVGLVSEIQNLGLEDLRKAFLELLADSLAAKEALANSIAVVDLMMDWVSDLHDGLEAGIYLILSAVAAYQNLTESGALVSPEMILMSKFTDLIGVREDAPGENNPRESGLDGENIVSSFQDLVRGLTMHEEYIARMDVITGNYLKKVGKEEPSDD